MDVKNTTLQTIPSLGGILFLFVVTAVSFSTIHTENLHIDSNDQVLVVVQNNNKIKKLIPILYCIFTVIILDVIALPPLVSASEPFPKTFIKDYLFRPRSPT